METFSVRIIETLSTTVEVEADSREAAYRLVSDGWKNEKYVLDADDFISVTIHVEDGSEYEKEFWGENK